MLDRTKQSVTHASRNTFAIRVPLGALAATALLLGHTDAFAQSCASPGEASQMLFLNSQSTAAGYTSPSASYGSSACPGWTVDVYNSSLSSPFTATPQGRRSSTSTLAFVSRRAPG
jgi:hypothetical protein